MAQTIMSYRAAKRNRVKAPWVTISCFLAAGLSALAMSAIAPAQQRDRNAAETVSPTVAHSDTIPAATGASQSQTTSTSPAVAVEAKASQRHHLLTAEEDAFRKKLHALVEDVAATTVSDADLKRLKATSQAAARRRNPEAVRASADIEDPLARKLAHWMKLRIGVGTLEEYRAFLVANPLWPSRDLMRKRMEDIAFTFGATVGELDAIFKDLPPITGPGQAALASAHLALGDADKAKARVAVVWRTNELPRNFETGFLERFGQLLTPADHLARADRLLAQTYSRRARRQQRANAVRRLIPLLETSAQKAVTARLSLYLGQKGAMKLVNALPASKRTTPELFRQRAQFDFRAKRYTRAANHLLKAPAGAKSASPDADWDLRERVAKKLVEDGKPSKAYDVVKDARPEDENAAKSAAFFAGWIALQRIGDAAKAIPHFERMLKAADGPLSTSKANYWLGRAHQKAGNAAEAEASFKAGGAFLDTFHGALSRVSQDPPQRALSLPMPELPDGETVARFKTRDVIRAGVIADKAGVSRSLVRALFGHFAWRVESGGEILLSGAVAEHLKDTQISLRAGKAGVARGHPHYFMSYPVHRLPKFEPLTEPPPTELLLGIARQESEFNTKIVSRAGARGVLQVMPITARDVCRIYRTKCEIKRLLTDETYNTRIAAAYVATQMRVVENNMILTLTSYNAGPGRTRQWLRQRGDPREPKRNALDWVYLIPFDETRLYVQKVLSNVQVYRARLGEARPVRVDTELGITP